MGVCATNNVGNNRRTLFNDTNSLCRTERVVVLHRRIFIAQLVAGHSDNQIGTTRQNIFQLQGCGGFLLDFEVMAIVDFLYFRCILSTSSSVENHVVNIAFGLVTGIDIEHGVVLHPRVGYAVLHGDIPLSGTVNLCDIEGCCQCFQKVIFGIRFRNSQGWVVIALQRLQQYRNISGNRCFHCIEHTVIHQTVHIRLRTGIASGYGGQIRDFRGTDRLSGELIHIDTGNLLRRTLQHEVSIIGGVRLQVLHRCGIQ